MARPSWKFKKLRCPGRTYARSETKFSLIPTGEPSRIAPCRKPGKTTAKLFEISLRTTTSPTTPSTTGRRHQNE